MVDLIIFTFYALCISRLKIHVVLDSWAARTNTCNDANETGEKHRRSNVGLKHDKACNGDE